MAPAAIAPRMVSALKIPLPHRMATVSPGRIPRPPNPWATDQARSLSCRCVSRLAWSTTAGACGLRLWLRRRTWGTVSTHSQNKQTSDRSPAKWLTWDGMPTKVSLVLGRGGKIVIEHVR
jgi:hypothetical protein